MGFNIPSFAEMQFLATYYEWLIWIVALIIVVALLVVLLTAKRNQKSPLLGSLMAVGGFILALPALVLATAIGAYKTNSQIDFGPFNNILGQLAIQFQPLAYLSIFGGYWRLLVWPYTWLASARPVDQSSLILFIAVRMLGAR